MSLLAQIRKRLTVDVDSMDRAVAQRHTADGMKFCDMTSNQAIVAGEAGRPERRALVDQAISLALQEAKETGEEGETVVERVLDVLVRSTLSRA